MAFCSELQCWQSTPCAAHEASQSTAPISWRSFTLPPNHSSIDWLKDGNPAIPLFRKKFGDQMVGDPEKKSSFHYIIPLSTFNALKKATTELHAMFVRATEHVLSNPRYWPSFDLPDYYWPRAVQSFKRGDPLFMGRFDFSITREKGIRCFEYNADSASGLFESAYTQNAWATAAGLGSFGEDAGAGLEDSLVSAWQSRFPRGTVVHFFHDTDAEERYHATYMRHTATRAGLVCAGDGSVEGYSFDEQGQILDTEKRPVRALWKTWSYTTLLTQWDGQPLRRSGAVRLVDVCLNEGIQVMEPVWSHIPACKAILPVLTELFPNHPNLLLSTFTVTASMRQNGYVSKPVSGRCGENVELHLPGCTTPAERTEGKFGSMSHVYQELCKLPVLQGQHVQCNAFVVAGKYGGTLVRIAEEAILGYNSECVVLRVLPDEASPAAGRTD